MQSRCGVPPSGLHEYPMGLSSRGPDNVVMQLTLRLLSASIAVLVGAIAMPGVAAADPDPLAGAGAGLTAPAGIVRTPDGGLWVADEVRGVCRLALGAQPQLVDSPWCATGPEQEGPELPEP